MSPLCLYLCPGQEPLNTLYSAWANWRGNNMLFYDSLPLMQALDMDCYHASPAAVDAATHLGALWDTDAGDQPRVPVALQLYHAQQPSWRQVRLGT